MKIRFEIKNRFTGTIMFTYESKTNTIKETVERFLKENLGTIIRQVDLSNLDLSGIDFSNSKFDNSQFDNETIKNIRANDQVGMFNIYRNDLWAILLHSNEVEYLIKSLKDGKVNGSTYEGDCACLVGTIANSKHCKYDAIPGLEPDSNRPAERWFMLIGEGMTPENSEVVKLTLEWVEEFQFYISQRIKK